MPSASRASTVVLAERGWACTRAAAEVVGGGGELLGEGHVRALRDELARTAPRGPIRPAW
ncbi:hypothetical protein [Streptomyces sp. NPDC047841]|uniref:hypothetical protein n=1 Tax=Streptomyces sp. NPDC047841 TaxID=3154708 RepID=UPI003454460C